MINPQNIVRHYQSYELPELFIFCVCVAGKKASTTAPRVKRFCDNIVDMAEYGNPLFACLLEKSHVAEILRVNGIGCFNQKAETLTQAAVKFPVYKLLRDATIEDLESIKGVGPKTSRFFRMCHDPEAKHAALDTHILKWMRAQGIDCPKSTPTGTRYLELEQKFLSLVPEGLTPAEFDLQIWRSYANPPE